MTSKLAGVVTVAMMSAAIYAAPLGTPQTQTPKPVTPATPQHLQTLHAVPQAVLLGDEDCITVDTAKVHAAGTGSVSMVMDGPKPLLKYFPSFQTAQLAAIIIHNRKFDQMCFVEQHPWALMYWKSAGKVPSTYQPGEACIGVDPDKMAVAEQGGIWLVMQGATPLVRYSDKAKADRALTVIRAYHFARRCMIPPSMMNAPVMTFWLAM